LDVHAQDWENPRYRLLPMLRIQQLLFPDDPQPTLRLENGDTLTLVTSDEQQVLFNYGDTQILADRCRRFAVNTDLHPEKIRYWTDWIRDQVNETRRQISLNDALSDYLWLSFESLKASTYTKENRLLAQLQVAHHPDEAPTAYEYYGQKLEPLSRLFQITMQERYRFGDLQADAVREHAIAEAQRHRAEDAEGLLQGTAHSLKIPIQVAGQVAVQEGALRTNELLKLANNFVFVGNYVQRYRKEQRAGKQRPPTTWTSGADPSKQHLLLLTETNVRDWLELPVNYACERIVDTHPLSVVKRFKDQQSRGEHLKLLWKLPKHSTFCLTFKGQPVTRNQSEATAFRSAFTEIVVNAILHSDHDEPVVSIEVSHSQGDPPRHLVVAVQNNYHGILPFTNRQEFLEFLRGNSAVFGISTAEWACEALRWELIPSKVNIDAQSVMRFEVIAPITVPRQGGLDV
jgi:hypothetical protein